MVRAGRLINMLLLLQSSGRMTAGRLAEELEVSVRTVLRDVDALNEAGVPIYTIRGSGGGIELLEGFRTQLTGLSRHEAAALFLAGLPEVAAQLGMANAATAARLKLLGALPMTLRLEAESLGSWFHHVPVCADEKIPDRRLPRLVDAIADGRVIRLCAGDGRQREVEPVGLVLDAGRWHLVTNRSERVDVFEVRTLTEMKVTNERFTRPVDFDVKVAYSSRP